MTALYGTVVDVSTVNIGEQLTADVPAGATSLPVLDVSTFNDQGGTALLNGSVTPYVGIDEEAEAVVLAAPLAADALDGDRLEVYPAAPEKVALVDLGGDGDAISVSVPHALAPLLADGFREPGQGENVLVEERRVGEFAVVDVSAAPALVAGESIAEGTVSPDRLTTGVTTNLVTDPTFLGGMWPQVDGWEISTDPDGAFPGVGFLRSISRDDDHTVLLPYQQEMDSSYMLTDQVPVDADRVVRVNVLVRRDVASLTTVSGFPCRARVRVLFESSTVAATAPFEEFALADETVADEWTPLAATFTVPAGVTSFRAMVQAARQTAGAVDFIRPEVQVVWDRIQSSNYVEGEAGFLLDAENTQVQNLQVTDQVGAGRVSADALELAGMDLATTLSSIPSGLVNLSEFATPGSTPVNSGAVGATEVGLFEWSVSDLKADHFYMFSVAGVVDSTVATDSFTLRVRYTVDGSAPTLSTVQMDRTAQRIAANTSINHSWFYTFAEDRELVRMLFTLQRASGTGTGTVNMSSANYAPQLACVDLGLRTNVVYGTVSQKSKATGTADPTARATYTETFWATSTRSYDGDRTQRGDDPDRAYQGYISGTHGNTRSLVFFDHAAIQSRLAGATVKRVALVYKVQHAWAAAGMTLYLSSHNYTSPGSSWVAAQVNEDRAHWSGQKAGVTYEKELPLAVGEELKAGVTRGLGFGPAPSNSASAYYGYLVGGGSSSARPRLKITYER